MGWFTPTVLFFYSISNRDFKLDQKIESCSYCKPLPDSILFYKVRGVPPHSSLVLTCRRTVNYPRNPIITSNYRW